MPTISEALTLAHEAMHSGDHARAGQVYRQILAAAPEQPNALHGLGILAYQAGRFAEAEAHLRRTIAANPNDPSPHNNLNLVLRSLGRPAEAVACCQRALELAPQMPELHNNLGIVQKETGAFEPALASFHEAIRLKADFADAHYNLANTLLKLCRLDEAERSYRRSIELEPRDWQAYNNLGSLLQLEGRFPEAMACFDAALARQGQSAQVRRNRAMLQLLEGQWAEGWTEYEWRLQMPDVKTPRHPQPRWQGQPLAKRTILVCAEQGLGDSIQFIRYAPLVKQAGADRVLFECPPPLHALLGRVAGVDRTIASGRGESFDFYIPLLSLPAVFHTTLETIPSGGRYLAADPGRVLKWRGRIEGVPGFKVGIAWQGNPDVFGDEYRSAPVAQFEPLAQCPGVTLISLQKGHGVEQLAPLADRLGIVDLGSQLDLGPDAFVDTAAVMVHLDLVITTDTAIAHLAGALGVPVWVALQLAPNWRWLLRRTDSPWYPSMRLFRQSRLAAWDELFARMASELRSLSALPEVR